MRHYKGRGEHPEDELETMVESLVHSNQELFQAAKAMQKLCGEIMPKLETIERGLLLAKKEMTSDIGRQAVEAALREIEPTRQTAAKANQ